MTCIEPLSHLVAGLKKRTYLQFHTLIDHDWSTDQMSTILEPASLLDGNVRERFSRNSQVFVLWQVKNKFLPFPSYKLWPEDFFICTAIRTSSIHKPDGWDSWDFRFQSILIETMCARKQGAILHCNGTFGYLLAPCTQQRYPFPILTGTTFHTKSIS